MKIREVTPGQLVTAHYFKLAIVTNVEGIKSGWILIYCLDTLCLDTCHIFNIELVTSI